MPIFLFFSFSVFFFWYTEIKCYISASRSKTFLSFYVWHFAMQLFTSFAYTFKLYFSLYIPHPCVSVNAVVGTRSLSSAYSLKSLQVHWHFTSDIYFYFFCGKSHFLRKRNAGKIQKLQHFSVKAFFSDCGVSSLAPCLLPLMCFVFKW